MRECRGIAGDPARGAGVIFEDNGGQRGLHAVRMLDNHVDRIV